MPTGGIPAIVGVVSSYISSRGRNLRTIVFCSCWLLPLTAAILLYTLPPGNKAGGLCAIWFSSGGLGGMWPQLQGFAASNVGGWTKKRVFASTLFVGYCLGNVGGPLFFDATQSPRYRYENL